MIIAKQSKPSSQIFYKLTNKNIIERIKYSYNNEIDFNYLHYTQFNQQTPFACLTNAYTHIYMKSSRSGAVFRHTKGYTNVYGPLWTPTCICTMWTYFLIILYIFPFLFFTQKTLSSPISLTIT